MVWRRPNFLFAAIWILPTLGLAFPPGEPTCNSGRKILMDSVGDPLPPGGVARFGSQRLKHYGRARLTFTPDGKSLLSLGADNVFAQWSAANGQELGRFKPPGPFKVEESLQEIWMQGNVAQFRMVMMLMNGRGNQEHTYAGFTADGKKLAGAVSGKNIVVWDTAAGVETHRIPAGNAVAPAFSPNGCLLAYADLTGDAQKAVRVWDLAAGKEIWYLKLPTNRLTTLLKFSPDGSWLAGADGTEIRVWNVATGKRARLYQGHDQPISDFAFSVDGKWIASVATDQTARVWDCDSEEEVARWNETDSQLFAVAFAPVGNTLALGGMDGQIRIVNWGQQKIVRRLQAHDTVVASLVFSPDGKTLASSGMDGNIQLWDPQEGKDLSPPRLSLQSVAFQDDANLLLTRMDGSSLIGNWPTGKWKSRKDMSSSKATIHTISQRGDLLVLSENGADPHVFDGLQDKKLFPLENQAAFTTLAFSPDDHWLAAAYNEGHVRIWEIASAKEFRRLDNTADVSTLAFSPDGKTLALGCADHEIQLWELATGQLRGRFLGTQSNIVTLRFSPDNGLLAAACGDEAIRIWDVQSGRLLRAFVGHFGAVNNVAFSPDGRKLASGGEDTTIRCWEVATGKELHRLEGHRGGIVTLAFSPDGTHLATVSKDGTALVWDWNAAGPPPVVHINRKLESFWADLGRTDASIAFQAIGGLAAMPAETLQFLRDQLRPCPPVKEEIIAELIAHLNHDQYLVRAKAARALEQLGSQAAPALGKALAAKSSAEAVRRLQLILDRIEAPPTDPESLRLLRAVEVLERIGTSETLAFLKHLSQGAPNAALTREAHAAHARLAARVRKAPS